MLVNADVFPTKVDYPTQIPMPLPNAEKQNRVGTLKQLTPIHGKMIQSGSPRGN